MAFELISNGRVECRNGSITEHEEAVPVPAFHCSINPVFQSACPSYWTKVQYTDVSLSDRLHTAESKKSFACTFGITEVIQLFIAKVEAKRSSATHFCHT